VNAESLAVTPAGVAYIITKSPGGHSVVYRLPPRPDRHSVQTLAPVARVRFSDPILYGRLATGAAISADGRWLIIRTYLAAYLWRLRGGDVAAALGGRRRVIPLPLELQGEGITFSGDQIYVDSEGRRTPVYVGRFPILRPPFPSPKPQPTTTSGAPAGAPSAAASTSGHATKPAARSNRDWLAAVAAIAVLGAAVEYRRRRSRPTR
jgi:hypothetical protein